MALIFKVSGKLSPLFRRRRMQQFLRTMQPKPSTRILDVGGLPRFWSGVPIESQITLLNLAPLDDFERSFMTPNQQALVGDGTALPYNDFEFDLVFSNSVIEHLGTFEKQVAFASETQRVGRSYWVQTPAKEFWMEPHYLTPCIHWFPKAYQRKLLRNCTLWGLLGRPSPEIIELVLAELRLLPRREFITLFPRSQLHIERVLGWPKSYTAFIPLHARASQPQSISHNPSLQPN